MLISLDTYVYEIRSCPVNHVAGQPYGKIQGFAEKIHVIDVYFYLCGGMSNKNRTVFVNGFMDR